MAVLRRANILSQERIDVPMFRSIESAASSDFDTSITSWVTNTNHFPYVIRGFNISMNSAIGGAASNLQVIVDPGALLHTTASQSGTIFQVASGTPPQQLNGATNPIVNGAFQPNAFNYVGIDYSRFADPTTDAQSYFWDPSSNTESTMIVPQAIILEYEFFITTTTWATNVLPIAVVLTDAGNNVVSITDSRYLLTRLGQGGASPNPFYVYPWSQGRTENPSTSTSNSSDPFASGDKQLTCLKDWMDAVMTSLLEIKGTTFWYSLDTSGSIVKLREDAVNTVTTGVGTITHSLITAGLVNWSDPIYIKVVGSALAYEIAANASSSDIELADDEVAYITLSRDVGITPNLFYVYNSIPNTTTVTSIGAVPWTTNLLPGDFIRAKADPDADYTEIKTVDSTSQVTLFGDYVPAGQTSVGEQSVYSFGSYSASPTPTSPRNIFIAPRASVPTGQDIWWFLLRADNGGIPRVYVKFLGSELEQGESEEIDSEVPIGLLNYIGSSMQGVNNGKGPQYSAAASPGAVPQVAQVTFGAGGTVTGGQYWTISSSNNARNYYVWYTVNGSGVDPAPSAIQISVPVAILSTDSANAVATKTRTAILALTGGDFSAPAPVGAVLTITNTSAGTCTPAANFNVGAPFAIVITQSGTGIGNNFIHDGDNLTLAIKELDEELGKIVLALDSPAYSESITIASSTPATTDITIPVNSRLPGSPQRFYTVGQGTLEVYLNGQYLLLGTDWAEVGSSGTSSDEIETLQNLVIGDILEFRISEGGVGSGSGGVGPQGPPGPTGPAGADAIGGPIVVATKTTNYTATTSDNLLLGNATSGNIIFSLPAVSASGGHVLFFKKIDSSVNTVTIAANGSDLIDGFATFMISTQYESVTLVADTTSSSWWIV